MSTGHRRAPAVGPVGRASRPSAQPAGGKHSRGQTRRAFVVNAAGRRARAPTRRIGAHHCVGSQLPPLERGESYSMTGGRRYTYPCRTCAAARVTATRAAHRQVVAHLARRAPSARGVGHHQQPHDGAGNCSPPTSRRQRGLSAWPAPKPLPCISTRRGGKLSPLQCVHSSVARASRRGPGNADLEGSEHTRDYVADRVRMASHRLRHAGRGYPDDGKPKPVMRVQEGRIDIATCSGTRPCRNTSRVRRFDVRKDGAFRARRSADSSKGLA